jgi:hypothetical protein
MRVARRLEWTRSDGLLEVPPGSRILREARVSTLAGLSKRAFVRSITAERRAFREWDADLLGAHVRAPWPDTGGSLSPLRDGG